MPSVKVTANTSGAVLWNAHEHKKAELTGLKVDNQSVNNITLKFQDCFITDASKTNALGATQAAEDFSTLIASGKVRMQATVPTGEFVSFPKDDLEGCEFLGAATVIASVTTSDCVIVAQYAHK